jgi:hypothetical protein
VHRRALDVSNRANRAVQCGGRTCYLVAPSNQFWQANDCGGELLKRAALASWWCCCTKLPVYLDVCLIAIQALICVSRPLEAAVPRHEWMFF